MPRIKLSGVKAYVSNGKTYAYHRATSTKLIATYGSAEFFAELDAIERKHRGAAVPEAGLGTWGALVIAYKAQKFSSLAPRTRTDYDRVLAWLSNLDGMPLADWTRGFIVQVRDKAQIKKGRRFGNYVQSVISAVFSWGVDRGHVLVHPGTRIKKIKRPKDMPRANRPWNREEWDAVTQAAPPHLLAPLLLCGVLGWREGEAVTRPRGDYDRTNKTITRISSKNGKPVKTPVPMEVASALDALYPHDGTTLLVNSRGLPWSVDGFRASFFKMLHKLEAAGAIGAGLTVHGLRHTTATRMREMGFDLQTIADMLGQDTLGMAAHYARDADLQVKMRGVVKRLDKHRRAKTPV